MLGPTRKSYVTGGRFYSKSTAKLGVAVPFH